jgi:hypothetical protein
LAVTHCYCSSLEDVAPCCSRCSLATGGVALGGGRRKKKKQVPQGGQRSGARVLAKEAQAWGWRTVPGRGRRALEVGWRGRVYCSKKLDDGRRLGVLVLQCWVQEDRLSGKLLLAGYFAIGTSSCLVESCQICSACVSSR